MLAAERRVMTGKTSEMISLAQRYCALIEASGTEQMSWLKDVAGLLPRLHATINSLDGHEYKGVASLSADLDERFELYTHLVGLLGDRDSYWLEFDSPEDFHAMTGSLADDLTDIYCELKHGLRMVGTDPKRSVQVWREGFVCHWSQHLTDAERHLSALAAQGRLE